MKHLTYRLLSALIVLYFSLMMYRTNTGESWIASDGSDLRYLPIVLVLIVLSIIDVMRVLGNSTWKRNHSRKSIEVDASNTDKLHPCEFCKEIIEVKDKKYCSISCKFSSLRWRFLLTGAIILIMGFEYIELQFIAITIYLTGLLGIQLSKEEQELPEISIANFFGEGVPNFINNSSGMKNTKIYNIPQITVPQLNQDVNVCCYQTARLGERYCRCGKLVTKSMISVLN